MPKLGPTQKVPGALTGNDTKVVITSEVETRRRPLFTQDKTARSGAREVG